MLFKYYKVMVYSYVKIFGMILSKIILVLWFMECFFVKLIWIKYVLK